MGDSITSQWVDLSPEFFTRNGYLARGISGQTTPQMVVRFQQDVIDLKPRTVVILAGTNDIAGNTGATTNEMIQANLSKMADMAHENGIRVILSSILPAYDYDWKPGTYPSQRIIEMNEWIKIYCQENLHTYLDYWSAMVDERNGMKDQFTTDGVHVTKKGYELMQSLVLPVIEKVLGK